MIKIKQPQVGAIKDYHTILPNGLITQNGVSDEVVGTQLIQRFHSFKVSDIVNYETFDPQTDPETAQLLEDGLVPYCIWVGAEEPTACFLYILFPINEKFTPKQIGENPSDLVNLVTTVYDYVQPSVLHSVIDQYEDDSVNQIKVYLTEHGAYGFVAGSGAIYTYLPAFESCSSAQEALDLLDPNSTFTYELETPIIHNLASGGNPYMDFNVVEGGTYEALPTNTPTVETMNADVVFNIDGEDVNGVLGNKTVVTESEGTWKLKKIFGNTVAWNQFLKENKLVDMGLPSGTLWASCDIDVTKEDKLCDTPFTYEKSFFSWGNVDGHNPISTSAFDYDWGGVNAQAPWYEGQSYGSTQGNSLTDNIPVGDTYDAARVNVGSLWRMPTNAEFAELFANIIYINADGTEVDTTKTDKRVTVNGIVGLYIQSKINGSRLFFSCSGYGNGRSWYNRGSYGIYWSSTWSSARYARRLFFDSGGVYPQDNGNRYYGFALRPVITKSALVSIGKSNHKYALSSNNKNITDVTIACGSGNEPSTVAEFESWVDANIGHQEYYDYNTGELIPVKHQALKTVGFNQWDEEWEVGTIDADGQPSSNSNSFRSKNFCNILGGQTYNLYYGGFAGTYNKSVVIIFYNSEKQKVGNTTQDVQNFQFVTPDDACYFKLRSGGQIPVTTYNHDICINISDPSKNGTYVPYSTSSLPLTLTTLQGTKSDGTHEVMFPDGLKKAGNVYDEIDYSTGKAIKRVGSRAYSSADSSDNTVITDRTVTYYELAEPIEYTIDGFIQEPKRIIASSAEVKTVYAGQTPVWYAYYGWDYNTSTLTVTRIGNTTWHKELPIQSKMRRCAVKDDGTVKYISSWDYTKYEDGNTVDYTGGDGQIMVEIPEYYYESYEETVDGVVHKILKLYPYAQIGQKSKKFYCGAFEGITDDASSNTPKLYSISTLTGGTKDGSGNYLAANWTYTTNAADYRGSGGTNDNGIKSNWSRPRTSLNITNFRDRATNRGTGWSQLYFTACNSILRLYTVEYCNFNSQAAFNSTLTVAGYHQGGLGTGVTNADSSAWNSFNNYNPFVPCGVTKELGSNTGIIGVTYASGEFASAAYTTYVPSYRGIENPFGHIWKWIDGYTKYGEGSTATVYTCDDITKFSDSVTNQNVPDGYSAKGTHSIGEGNFGDWYWNSDGTFVHKTFGTGPFSDYAYHNNTGTRALYSGGCASGSASAGLFSWDANFDPSYVSAYFGGRLYYTPSEN